MATTKNGSSPKVTKSRATRKSPGPEDIALRAYQIYLERAGAPGNPLDDWTRAERELLATNGKPGRKSSAKSKAA
ncbi:MAG: DUF2934 domain-containing protein [Candidatus Acidiferrum sp.]